MNLRAALGLGTSALTEGGLEGAGRDARRLLAHAAGIAPDRVMLHLEDELSEEDERRFWAHVQARLDRRPVAQIIGARLFFGRNFIVTEDVLDPRPETETLIVEALGDGFDQVLDLGTGSGCILLTLLAERPGATGIGADISAAALEVARRNADALDVAPRAALVQSDWFDAVGGVFDLIVSNPPYIAEAEMSALAPELAFEPRQALTDGADGLSAYRTIAAGAPAHLAPGGRLMVEIGWRQGDAVAAMFRSAGLVDVQIRTDLDGRDRVVMGRMSA